MSRFRLDARQSRFTVQAYTSGLLSFLGHDPSFAIGDFSGVVAFEDDLIAKLSLEMTVDMRSLTIAKEVKPADRNEIESRMQSEVLNAAEFPEIVFRAAAADAEKLAPGRYRLLLDGTLFLHGTVRPHRLDVELWMFVDGLRLMGETEVRMSDHGIEPITGLGGTIQLKDAVKLKFELVALLEST